MNILKETPTWDSDTNGANIKTLRVLVECPKGTINKYEYTDLGYLTIVRQLNKKYKYPFSYGSIPQTLGGDKDPLDAIILGNETIQAGVVVNCNVLGVVKTIDNGEQDDKIICVPYFVKAGDVDLFSIYKYLNNYKFPKQEGTFVNDILGPEFAIALISEGIERFEKVRDGRN